MMSIKYPSNWERLKLPAKRAELVEYLKDIAGNVPGSDPGYRDFDIDQTIHFFFDDTNLGDSTRSNLGEILFDSTEEKAVKLLTAALEAILKELGDQETYAFLQHPSWPSIRQLATEAMAILRKRGLPQILR